MPAVEEAFNCSGVTGSVSLYRDRMVINSKWGVSKSYQLPLKRLHAVVIERKSVIPFATLTILAAAMTIVIRYNKLWFLVDLAPKNAGTVSAVALFATVVFVFPTFIRTLFVSVTITWDGDPTTFRVGFVPVRPGKRLAKKFQELSAWG